MTNSSSKLSAGLGTAYGKEIFFPVTALPGGLEYVVNDGPVLVMLVSSDVRINALVAWATSAKHGLSAIILLTMPETEPYTRRLEGMLEEVLSPLEILVEKLAIPDTYDQDEARYDYLSDLFDGYLSTVIRRIVVDLTTGPNTIAQQLYEAASNAGVKKFQTVEGPETLTDMPPFDGLREGVDYEIRSVPEVKWHIASTSEVAIDTMSHEFNAGKQLETTQQIITASDERRRLREMLSTRLEESDLKTFCYDMGIEYGNISKSGDTKQDKVINLILFCQGHNRFDELKSEIKEVRPDIAL